MVLEGYLYAINNTNVCLQKATIIQYNIIGVMLLELEGKQQKVTDEIMKYKELLDEKIITEEEFSIKEKELLRKTIK